MNPSHRSAGILAGPLPRASHADGSGPPFNWIAWLLTAGILALHAWMLNRYAVDFPSADDFVQVLAIPGYLEHSPGVWNKIAFMFSLAVDHRIFTLRSIAWAQASLFGGFDFRGLIFLGNAMAVAAGALVLFKMPANMRACCAPLFALLVTSPSNFVGQYWTSGALAHGALLFYALSSLYCLSRTGAGWQVAAMLLAACAPLTLANGLAIFPAAVVQLWIARRRRTALTWAIVATAVVTVYFIGYATPADRPSVVTELDHPLRMAGWFTITLGSMANGYTADAALGCVLLLALLWAAPRIVRGEADPVFAGWSVFLLASAVAITVGRAPLGLDALVNTRYRIYSEMALLVTLALVATLSAGFVAARVRMAIAIALSVVALPWFAMTYRDFVPGIAEFSFAQRNARDHYVATGGHGDYGDYPPQDFGDYILKRTHDASQFNPEQSNGPVASALVVQPGPSQSASAGSFAASAPFVVAGALSVRGQTDGAQKVAMLWLRSDARAYGGTLRTERIYDLSTRRGRLGFWNTWRLGGVEPGRYRVGYAFAKSEPAPVFWTDDWITVN